MKILIVDDEQPARDRLKTLVEKIDPGYELLEAANGLEALRMAEEHQPDIALLDIRMPTMDGLEAARHMSLLSPSPAVVFTTAYDEHALKAFEANAIDYLMKPVAAERLSAALERAQVIQRAKLEGLDDSAPLARMRTHLGAVYEGNLQLIPINEIRYLRAEQKYVTVTWGDHEAVIDESLKAIEEEFGDLFMRIHRNTLVSTALIESLHKGTDGNYLVTLRGTGERLGVSRRYSRQVKRRLKQMAAAKE